MQIIKFEDIIAWQKAQDFTVEIYNKFSSLKDRNFKDQILRAVVSISNNIAEGFERNTDNDFLRFLYIAQGSCSEVKSMLYLSVRLDLISKQDAENFIRKCTEISKVISGLIKSIKIKKQILTTDD